jgi:hypothetical protein
MPEREIGEERGRGTAARQGFLGEARRGFPGSRFRDALRAAASSAGDGRGRVEYAGHAAWNAGVRPRGGGLG